ncbi:MAG TPA: M48 family metallopeptidase [Acidimicrobiales bacterium]|nr:M48 family metallopeptidase [Acidimicrobiales bacterium]
MIFDQVKANKRRSVLLIAGFIVLIVATVWAVDLLVGYGPAWVIVAFVFAGGSAFFAYWKSDAVALAMSHARPADPVVHARLHNLVEGLCIAGGLPKPRVYVVEDTAPNAFATGRNPNHAAIAVTTGLLDKLDRVELEAVLSHELAHIKNYDILVSTLAVTLVGVIVLIADFSFRFLWWGGASHKSDRKAGGPGLGAVFAVVGIVLLVITPVIAKLMQAAISRRREQLADMSGVALTRYPPGLISALEKLQADETVVHSASRATAHLWIEGPVPKQKEEGRMAWLGRLFDTHPPLADRIEALREL